MIKKLKYFAPRVEETVVTVMDRIMDSGKWYQKGGQGDFDYIIEEEDEFE